MKYLYAVIGLLFLLVGCNDTREKEIPASNTNRRFITQGFNRAKSPQEQSVDSAMVTKIEKAALGEPDEYKAMAALARGLYYSGISSYELALKSYEKGLLLVKNPQADTLKAIAYCGIGNCYKHTGDYPKALDNLYKSLKIYETRKNTKGIASINAFIGEVHLQKNDFAAAKDNLIEALKLLDNNKGQYGWLDAAHSLANVYGMSDDFDRALQIDEEGIRISDSIHSDKIKATFLDNKANCFLYSGRLDSAEYYFNECLKIDIRSGNKKNIADTYSNLGNLASFQHDFKKAEALTLKSIDILDSVNNRFNLGKSYQILCEIYTREGDYKKALDANMKFYVEYKKAVNEKKEASLAEFKILHETDKKEKELAEQKVELLQKNAEVRQRNNLVIGLSLLLFFIVLIAYMINRQQKLRNSQQQQEHELKTAIQKIETQNKLQQQRLQISRDLHDNIGAQLTFIISSVDNIKYAFELGKGKLDSKLQNISVFAKETIVELRDTIWAMNNAEITFEDLRTRIFNFIEKAREVTENIEFKFHVSQALGGMKFSSIVGMNIHRTIQEAINNAIKYAAATEISIDIRPEGNDIRIVIKDNGSGFDIATAEKGNGLANMEKRIGDIGGKISIVSEIGSGTQINILLPEDFAAKKHT